jgi:hypothetical protein
MTSSITLAGWWRHQWRGQPLHIRITVWTIWASCWCRLRRWRGRQREPSFYPVWVREFFFFSLSLYCLMKTEVGRNWYQSISILINCLVNKCPFPSPVWDQFRHTSVFKYFGVGNPNRDLRSQNVTHPKMNQEISCPEVLFCYLGGLEASPTALKSFKKYRCITPKKIQNFNFLIWNIENRNIQIHELCD